MKKFITVLLNEVGLRSLLVRYHKSRLLSALADMKRFGTETSMPVWCSQRFQRHHESLRRLGFVEQREFTLHRRAIWSLPLSVYSEYSVVHHCSLPCRASLLSGPENYRTFYQLMRSRFADGYWSCATIGSRVIVTAPPSQMSEWRRFLLEYDQVMQRHF